MYVIRERLFRLGEDSDITDQAGQPVLHVDGKVLSLHNRLILQDPAGREVGQVHRNLAALRILASVLALDLAIDAEHDH